MFKTYSINFLDGLNINSIEEAIEFINLRDSLMKDRDICELLEGIVNYKLFFFGHSVIMITYYFLLLLKGECLHENYY